MERLKNFLKAEKRNNAAKTSGVSKWVWGLIISVLAMSVLGVYYFQAWRKGRELAKLKHEKDVLEQEQAVERIMHSISENQEVVDFHHNNVLSYQELINDVDAQLTLAEEEYNDAKNSIDHISSWDDVDKYRQRPGSTPRS